MRLRTLSNRDFVKTRAVMIEEHEGRMGVFGVGMIMKHKKYHYEGSFNVSKLLV